MLKQLQKRLKQLKNPNQAKILQKFFKTAPHQYGAGDIFLGLTVPQQRTIAKPYIHLNLIDIKKLLYSKIHEYRFTALLILIKQYRQGDKKLKKKIYNFYLKHSSQINNWDLVDLSAPKIVGAYLLNKSKQPLFKLACSPNLWQKRIAIVATFEFIKNNQFTLTLKIAQLLLNEQHDLIHKAVGWMLREVGKRNQPLLEKFLQQHLKQLPRTTLRYAIEKFPERKRQSYLKK